MKWYFKTSVVVFAFLTVGPLALPLLWFHPTYKRTAKIIWTLIVLELTFILAKVTAASMHSLYQSYQQIMEAYKPLLN